MNQLAKGARTKVTTVASRGDTETVVYSGKSTTSDVSQIAFYTQMILSMSQKDTRQRRKVLLAPIWPIKEASSRARLGAMCANRETRQLRHWHVPTNTRIEPIGGGVLINIVFSPLNLVFQIDYTKM